MVLIRQVLIRGLILINLVVFGVLVTSKKGDMTETGSVPFMIEATVKSRETIDRQIREGIPSQTKLFPCDDLTPRSYLGHRGIYPVLYNYVKATRTFHCDESITYTTHTDWTYLDNLIPLLERWQGPLSVALYAPGSDFEMSLKYIQYLRECSGSSLVKEYATFHIYFSQKHMPNSDIPPDPENLPVDCRALVRSLESAEKRKTYKQLRKLSYPVNVGRNIAKEMSTTHYVFPSDIELYPNPELIPDFLEMLRRNDTALRRPAPKVFVSSIFEVEANVNHVPRDKRELVEMLRNESAIPFHKYVCPHCHHIPKSDEWVEEPIKSGLSVFHIGKRHKPFQRWEPIYIGTKDDPMYDERLSWEGQGEKMVQAYILCVLDYEFHILDNAFLVHRPGIKRKKKLTKNELLKKSIAQKVIDKQKAYINSTIIPEITQIYGTRENCQNEK